MRAWLLSFLLFLFTCPLPATPTVLLPRVKTVYYQLGESPVQIKVYRYGDNKDLFFINLHDDEVTAVTSAHRILEQKGGTLVRIDNGRQRNIRFRLDGKYYAFDPNRIFSRAGIMQTLNTFGLSSPPAIDEISKFAARLIELLPPAPTCVIALHNNSDGEFSITSYMTGHEREQDAKAVFVKSLQDQDDMLLTTDSSFYKFMTHYRFNIVLQDNTNARQDGSLSVYCGERSIRYINCETEHGKYSQYMQMITAVHRYVSLPVAVPRVILYNYKLLPSADSVALPACDIWFGEKKVGLASLKPVRGAKSMQGQLQLDRSFPLYDNMDFFYYPAGRTTTSKIDLRIDPTRPKKLYDPSLAVVPITIIR